MFIKKLRQFVENPYVNLVVALLLFYSGASEAWVQFKEAEEVTIGAHHGIMLLSILHVLKTIPEFFEGLDHIKK